MPFVHAQKKVLGEITTKDTAKLSILGVYQDQFPKVSVVFRAEKTNGNPVFGLEIKDMSVRENGDKCEVVSLREISQKKPINIGAVLDHSGSMQFDEKQLIDLGFNPYYDYDVEGNPIWPKGYKAPIDVAKTALMSFVDQFNFSKDKMSVVGFSTKVDKILKLSDNKKKINKMINSMKADDLTAFFDALIEGMQQIRNADGLSVVVALTDGNDNRSKNGYEDVVKLSKELNIPVYLIGLGDVNADSLQMLADATNGEFFYAKSASALSDIYGKISSKLQAFYDINYCFTVDEHVFNPPPKVKSGVIRCVRNDRETLGCNEKLFIQVVKATFNQRRKTIRNSVKSLLKNNTFEHRFLTERPERLGVEEFIELTKAIEQYNLETV